MTEEQKARIGDKVAYALENRGVLYTPEIEPVPAEDHAPWIHDVIVQSVIDAITAIDRESPAAFGRLFVSLQCTSEVVAKLVR